jgi:hypothetical protein
MLVQAIAVMLGVTISIYANPSKSDAGTGKVKINQAKPSVFISFVKVGKREPLESGESSEGVWLRLHNNTRWTVWLPSFGVPEGAGDIGVHYDLERMPSSDERQVEVKDHNCPSPYSLPHPASFRPVKPGKSVLFSIPRESFTSYQRMRVFFFYAWESFTDVISSKEPRHFVYFSSSEIPKENIR